MKEKLKRSDVTNLLIDWSGGDKKALDRLMPLVYDELHRLAEQYMRKERGEHTLQATALVNEAYMRLIDQTRVEWQNKAHFFAVSSQIMRRILVDYARRHEAKKRGGDVQKISLEDAPVFSKEQAKELIEINEALESLIELDERRGRVVELRFFGGLSVKETAEVLDIAPNTVVRDWNFAKAWLFRHIQNGSK